MLISIIVCTYNPDPSIFRKCLTSVYRAVEKYTETELIIIDNNSTVPVSQGDFLKGFDSSRARIIVEPIQGLTPARIRGIREAKGDLLVFVDDDNFIAHDFLIAGAEIANRYPFIGSFSGQVILEFEAKPAEWTKKYWGLLVYRQFDKDVWSNLPHLTVTMPCGAGMYVRKNVATHYLELNDTGKRKVQMDRTGNSFFSGGDNDLAACACDIGMGVGLFHQISLQHYITKERLSLEYLLKLTQGIAASAIIFRAFRNEFPAEKSARNRIANMTRKAFMNATERKFFEATLKGEEQARKMLNDS